MKKSTHAPTSSDAENIQTSPKTYLEAVSQMNWGAENKSSPQNKFLAGTIPSQQPSEEDLKLLAELMRGRQRLP